MANFSTYLQNKIIDANFRGISYSFPATIYIGLTTAVPTATLTGSTIAEVQGASYSRQAVVGTTANWLSTNGSTSGASSGTSGNTDNVNAITFTQSTENWGTLTGVALLDSATTGAGNMLYFGSLSSSKVMTTGDTFQFAATTGLTINLN